jgi:hypothetical protein
LKVGERARKEKVAEGDVERKRRKGRRRRLVRMRRRSGR